MSTHYLSAKIAAWGTCAQSAEFFAVLAYLCGLTDEKPSVANSDAVELACAAIKTAQISSARTWNDPPPPAPLLTPAGTQVVDWTKTKRKKLADSWMF